MCANKHGQRHQLWLLWQLCEAYRCFYRQSNVFALPWKQLVRIIWIWCQFELLLFETELVIIRTPPLHYKMQLSISRSSFEKVDSSRALRPDPLRCHSIFAHPGRTMRHFDFDSSFNLWWWSLYISYYQFFATVWRIYSSSTELFGQIQQEAVYNWSRFYSASRTTTRTTWRLMRVAAAVCKQT